MSNPEQFHMAFPGKDDHLELIDKLLAEAASGNFSYKTEPPGNAQLTTIVKGIKILSDNLQAYSRDKQELMRIYEGLVDMIFILDKNLDVQQVNDATIKGLSFPEGYFINKPVTEFFNAAPLNELKKLKEELGRENKLNHKEYFLKPRKGKPIPVYASISPLHDPGKNVNGYLFIARDISRVKHAEEQLKIKNHELNTFIYRASHDLKGPLSSILGLIYLAKLENTSAENMRNFFNLIEERIHRLETTLVNLLQLGKITQSETAPDKIYLDKIVEDILKSYEFQSGYSHVKRIVKIEVKEPFISKMGILQAILQNLIENGLKYHDKKKPNPYIKLSITEQKRHLKIVATDNGTGIHPNIINRIFDMFYRGTQTSNGSGLGLYLVKTSVEALKGSISVKSKVGEGSVFTILIPKK